MTPALGGFGQFPVSEYYSPHIEDAETLTRSGGWWTAVLLIRDPKSHELFISIYRWQHTETGWKTRKTFTCRKKAEAAALIDSVKRFSDKLSS
jgi:hypothetical protein